ncbi:hypothetical protein KFL_001200290 [Klebsormidium nitens]|uniref:Uncharacterized protein n=1 Tax=Klebsormidium nitens TaxID=105231 RepID=A0A1Y1HVR4_KLENI|nr:hypothetical protein KFL_001200290 [Klebsormidium nitens]|eukprot:GAQ82705.1 hypothetical protein KFL_001200290 [Klebsormidium nitens]
MQVLNQLMDNGLFDTLRKSITAELESNMELKKFTTAEVERSQVLQAPGAERRSRRELFEALRRELQSKVLERASEAAWNAILSKDSVGRQIEEQVEKTWWELNGWGTPPERIQPPKQKPAEEKPLVVVEHSAPSLTNASGIGSGTADERGPDAVGAADQPEAAAQVTLGAGAAPREASHSLPEEVQYVPLRMDLDQAPGEGTEGGAPPSSGVLVAEVRTAGGTESEGQSRLLSDAPAEAFGQVGVKAAAVDDPTSIAAEPANCLEGEATRAAAFVRMQDGSEPHLEAQEGVVKQDDPSLKESEQEHVGSRLMDGPGGLVEEKGETHGQNTESSVEGNVEEKGDKSGAEQIVHNEVQPSSMEIAAPGLELEASKTRDPRRARGGDRDTDVQLHPSIGSEATEEFVSGTGPVEGSATPSLVPSSKPEIVSSPIEADVEMTEATALADVSNAVEAGQLQTGGDYVEAAADGIHPSVGGKRGVETEEEQAGRGTEEQGATEAIGQLDGRARLGGAGSEVQVSGGLGEVEKPAGSSNNQEQGVSEIGAAPVGALISEPLIEPQTMEEG